MYKEAEIIIAQVSLEMDDSLLNHVIIIANLNSTFQRKAPEKCYRPTIVKLTSSTMVFKRLQKMGKEEF